MSEARSEIRSAWVEFLGRFSWEIFYTQTYMTPVKYPRLAMDRLSRVLRSFCIRYDVSLVAFVVAEEHKLGSYHAHSILAALSSPSLLSLRNSLKFLYLLGSERFGMCRAVSIQSIGGVVGYVAKYLTKFPADYDFYFIYPV